MRKSAKTTSYRNLQGGQVVLITVLLFLFISLSIVLGFGSAAVKNFKNTRDAFLSKQSYFTAESGVEDAIYRLSSGKTTTPSMNLSLNGADTVTTIADVGAEKEIISTGDAGGINRKVQTRLLMSSTGASYNYGIQVGSGGLLLGNTASGINGNVYVNGNITGQGWSGSFATGTAIAANGIAVTADQVNDTPTTPARPIDFDRLSGNQDFAQSFSPSVTSYLNHLSLYIKKTSTPGSISYVYIMTDNGGSPGTQITYGTFASAIGTSYSWINVDLNSNPELIQDTTYWIVIDVGGSVSSTKYYTLGGNASGYARGEGKIGTYNSSWSATSSDAYFKVYLGSDTSTIEGVHVGSNGTGDAWAHTVNNSKVEGNLYCQVGTGNVDENGDPLSCDTSRADPVPRSFSVTQEMIDLWKAQAEAGGTIAGYNIPAGTTSLGPKKISGNLTSSSNVTLNLTGTLWITGDYSPGGGNQYVNLDTGYGDNSGVIIVDGKVDISNGVAFNGVSGHPQSYILLLSTSYCPTGAGCSGSNAIYVGNHVGAVLLDAPNGTVYFKNGGQAKEATGNKIELENGANVTYETGLADAHFSSGPGGGYGVSTWREVE